ncbi:MAG: hypothetical protein ACNA71_07230 [Kiritimatiellia bacterium]
MDQYETSCPLTQVELLQLDFLKARNQLLEIAAFLDRLDRAKALDGADDFRLVAFRRVLKDLIDGEPDKVKRIQMGLSDMQIEPLLERDVQNAFGAVKA